MGKRGPKPKSVVKIKWSPKFAYAIGLLATDGSLSNDNLLIDLTSKDREQLENFCKCLRLKLKIGIKWSGNGSQYLRVQFKNRIFYDFLLSIGLTQAKSLTIGEIKIPSEYFFDFLRGCFDGDGCSYSYWDPRWSSSFMFYISFSSGSVKFLNWLREEVEKRIEVKSHISVSKGRINPFYQLKYSKYAAIDLVKEIYKGKNKIFLKRKKLKINKCLSIMGLNEV